MNPVENKQPSDSHGHSNCDCDIEIIKLKSQADGLASTLDSVKVYMQSLVDQALEAYRKVDKQ